MPGQRYSIGFVGIVRFSCWQEHGPEIYVQAHNYIAKQRTAKTPKEGVISKSKFKIQDNFRAQLLNPAFQTESTRPQIQNSKFKTENLLAEIGKATI
jgi:hypothetical protein